MVNKASRTVFCHWHNALGKNSYTKITNNCSRSLVRQGYGPLTAALNKKLPENACDPSSNHATALQAFQRFACENLGGSINNFLKGLKTYIIKKAIIGMLKKEKQPNEKKQGAQFEVLVDEQNQVAKFANSVKIWHTPFEFYLDFGQFIPGTNKIKVNARIVITPQHAASLRAAILDNIAKYESQFGKIREISPMRIPGSEKDKKESPREATSEYVG